MESVNPHLDIVAHVRFDGMTGQDTSQGQPVTLAELQRLVAKGLVTVQAKKVRSEVLKVLANPDA